MKAARLTLAAGALAAALLAGCAVAPTGTPPPAPAPARAEPPADPDLPPSAAQTLAQRFPYLRALSHAAGHLQVDDADDLAVVRAPLGQTHDAVVAVLVTGADGRWRVVNASRPVAPGCETCTTTVDIAHHLLSVHALRPADPDFERVTWQFGYQNGGEMLRLVGVTAAQPAGDDPIAHSYAVSTDLVTGTKIDTLDAGLSDPARRRELRSSVGPRPPIAFAALAFTTQALWPELQRRPAAAFAPADALPAPATALLRARFPGMAVLSHGAGPLRADNLRDLVLALAPPGTDADPIAVLLLAQPNGALRVAASSGPLTRGCHGCDVQVQIANKALVVQATTTDAAGTHVTGWQFVAPPKDRAGVLRLIGVRTVLATRTGGGDTRRYVNTANLVTGDKLDVIEDVVNGRRTRVQRASTVPLRPPIPFAGFALDAGRLDAETRRDFTP